MAGAGLLTSPLGLWLAQRIPNAPLTSLVALVLGGVAWRMFVQAPRELRGAVSKRATVPPCQLDPVLGKLHWNLACARSLLLAGSAAGLLSGLLGVRGGFVLVPTLLAMSDLP